MDRRKERSCSEPIFPQSRRTPSFSSSLLDSIYRSIDEESDGVKPELGYYTSETTTTINKHITNFEKTNKTKLLPVCSNSISISSSSDSSTSGVTFSSSSETDSSSRSSRAEKLKNIEIKKQNRKCSSGLLKKPKSPGARIASFLNSIFSSNTKKMKICSVVASDDVSSDRKMKPSCSYAAASSFSRSCLSSKKPSSSKKNHSGGEKKRTVRFYPVSVIVDEDSRPCGHKCISNKDEIKKIKRDYLTSTHKLQQQQKKMSSSVRKFDLSCFLEDDEDKDEDEDDDAWSCSSSDLFELPVFETTNFKTNQAIANKFRF